MLTQHWTALVCKWTIAFGLSVGLLNGNAITSAKELEQPMENQVLQQCRQDLQAQDYEAALRSCNQSSTIFRQTQNQRGEAKALTNLGTAYLSLSRYRQAILSFRRSLFTFRQLQDPQNEAKTLNNLSNVYLSLSQYHEAIVYYRQALAIFQRTQDQENEAKTLNNLGNTYLYQADHLRAIEYYRKALKIFQQRKDLQGEARTLNNLGNAYLASAQIYMRQYYQQAIQMHVFLANPDETWLGTASAAYESALPIFRQINDPLGEAGALNNLGNVFLTRSQPNQAISYYQQSLAIFQKIKDRLGEGRTLNNLGQALFLANKLPEAEPYLLRSIEVLESLRQGLEDTHKVFIAENQQNPYDTLQQLRILQNRIESALEVAERGRARAFAELLLQRIPQKKSIATQPINIAAIKQIAREQNATLVEYSNINDERMFIWIVKPSGEVIFREVDLTGLVKQGTSLPNLVTAARCLGNSLCEERVVLRGSQPIAFSTIQGDRQANNTSLAIAKNKYLQQLHELLIQPIADVLPQNPNNRIIFIPQRTLFLVPFAALQNQQGQYLIDQYAITIAPSIQVLQLTRQQRQQQTRFKGGNTLLVGNPGMPRVSFHPTNPPTQLSPLPGAEAEAKAIAKILKVPALIGKQATKSTVVKQMLNARIIHLATHGLLDDFEGLGVPGAIALAPDDEGEPNDGLLTANELFNLKLNAELVVLSACDTGRGRITGDGVLGLSRSLITAGVPSVIVSLWAVPDAPTADLMIHFYQNLKQGRDKATALRQAMIATKKDYPDPVAWAAFMLIGEAQ